MFAKGDISWHTERVKNVSAVLFDFDGILVDTEWAIYQSWKNCFTHEGQELPLSIYTRCIGSDFATWSPKTYLEELTGKQFDWNMLDKLRQQEIVAELSEEGAMPGVIDLLDLLTAHQIPCAVVSSSSHHWVDDWLDKLHLTRYFDHVICRGDAPHIKPAPDLYLAAAHRFSLNPAHCLVIEDSLNGVISAHAASMPVWAVPNRVTNCLDFSQADRIWGSLAEVVAEFSIQMDDA